MVGLYDINCASARHLQAFASIPQELAEKIVAYRKKRIRICHIDELCRIRGLSRKYCGRLVSVFYVPNQFVPRIGAQLPYINTLSSITVQQKHQKGNGNLKKRKRKIKRRGNKRKNENIGRKRTLQKKGISTQNKKCYHKSTNQNRINTQNKPVKNRKGNNQSAKRQQTANTVQNNKSLGSIQSHVIQRANDKMEMISRWAATVPKFEGGGQGDCTKIKLDNIPGHDNMCTYYYEKYETQKSPKSKVERVVFEERIPEKNHGPVGLYQNCIIL